jgi:glycosyltransferase involved in cell wall biosynthesis
MEQTPDPFFSRAAGPHLPRRILLFSYHFPPSSSAGALRWQEMAHDALARGWGLDVLTLDPSQVDMRDDTRLQRLPEGIRVFGIPEAAPLLLRALDLTWRSAKRMRRSNSSGPSPQSGDRPMEAVHSSWIDREDVRLGWRREDLGRAYRAIAQFFRARPWAQRSLAVAMKIVDPAIHELIVSCGPPHLPHVAAASLARMTGLPWIADFRDSWSLGVRSPASYASPLWWYLASRYEARVVDRANLIVMNTAPAADAMRTTYPEAAKRIIAVMNGTDGDVRPAHPDPGCFRICYAGSIYGDRDPRPLFRAVRNLVADLDLTTQQLSVQLVGKVETYEGQKVRQIAHEEGIDDFVELHRPRKRSDALELLARAAVLVNLPQDIPLAIQSKLFDYVQFPAWLLIMEARGTATELLFRGTTADVVEPADIETMSAVLRRCYQEWRDCNRPAPIGSDPRFHRRHQAELLFEAIDEIVRSEAYPSAQVGT